MMQPTIMTHISQNPAAVLMAVSLPHRTTVSEITIATTIKRDMTADLEAALTKRTTDA
jgi:hypothetical protein